MDGEAVQQRRPSGSREIHQVVQGETNWWRSSQVALSVMLILLLLGVLAAIGHHLFYSYLNNQVVDQAAIPQNWGIRIGTAFSYLVKTVLVGAVAVVYAQAFWFIVRRQAFEIGSLDDFFSLLNNPLLFFNRRLYGEAIILLGLALVSWLLPISAVLVPGALTVGNANRTVVAPVNVPVLAPMNNYFGLLDATIAATIQAISLRVMFAGGIIPWTSPCGMNCSYTFSFLGPAYQCVNLGPFSSTQVNLTQIQNSGFLGVADHPPPNSTVLYYGIQDPGNETSPVGIWIFYDALNQTLKCDLYNATYSASVSYMDNHQTTQYSLDFHNLITDGRLLFSGGLISAYQNEDLIADDSFWARLNLLLLQGFAATQLTGWVVLMGDAVQLDSDVAYWPGVVRWSPPGVSLPPSDASQVLAFDDLAANVQNYLANVTLSLINYRNANLNLSHLANVTSNLIIETITPATSTSFPLIFIYSRPILWQGYACALGFTTICVGIGAILLYTNGVAGRLTFSQVLVTTRNPKLNKISEGAELGGKYITARVKKVQVKYEKLSATGKMGFGVKD